jgi:death on curing protein
MKWILEDVVLALQREQITSFGGSTGLRDRGLLLSALARAPNLAAYNPASGISELAAAYAFGIVRNHPFVDANKRTALAVLGTFLNCNGYELMASDEESCEQMVGVAEGMIGEKGLGSWVRAHIKELNSYRIKRRRANQNPDALYQPP